MNRCDVHIPMVVLTLLHVIRTSIASEIWSLMTPFLRVPVSKAMFSLEAVFYKAINAIAIAKTNSDIVRRRKRAFNKNAFYMALLCIKHGPWPHLHVCWYTHSCKPAFFFSPRKACASLTNGKSAQASGLQCVCKPYTVTTAQEHGLQRVCCCKALSASIVDVCCLLDCSQACCYENEVSP